MKEKWQKTDEVPRLSDGHPMGKKWTITDTIVYKPGRRKLTHSPSLRAIRNYNELPIETIQGNNDEYQYEYYSNVAYSTSKDEYDYPTLSTRSMNTTISSTSAGSEPNQNNEMGSSVKLVTAKVEMSVKSCCIHFTTILCSVATAANFGTIYRLPQTTILHGGAPFMIINAFLTVTIGLPLLFLELGIGQMAEEGFIKSWRAVPFFKGIGYVKLLAGCLLSVYYPLYIALSLIYLISIINNGSVPFQECHKGVVITLSGYAAATQSGHECLTRTFLSSPFNDPYYYGIYAAVLLFVWILIVTLSIRRTRSYIRALIILFFPTMTCYVALTTKSILLEAEIGILSRFFLNADWTLLKNAEIWYFAAIQVFFSTNVGFGSFVTNAGIIYYKTNPFWTAIGYIITNLIFGTGSIIITTIITGNTGNFTTKGNVGEVQLFASIYNAMISKQTNNFQYWMMAIYCLFIFSGFISMATLSYTLIKAIRGHDRFWTTLNWWKSSLIFGFVGFLLGSLILLKNDFTIVHLFDHYIVGNLILICVAVEVIALIAFYGTSKIQSDFEFMLGHRLNRCWLFLWWLIPLVLVTIFIWGLTIPLEADDPLWLYTLGWTIVFISFIFIFIIGMIVALKQDGYTCCDRLKASVEPSSNWGPKDPMLRHNWVQWNSKSELGERDFTLKRRGTKEYTRTAKRRTKKLDVEITGVPDDNYLNKTSSKDSAGSSQYNSVYYINQDEDKPRPHNRSDKGPYVVEISSSGHVCHRSNYEGVTEL